MVLIIGLGNPRKKFHKTRHNIGFRVSDAFQRKNRDVYYFSDFKFVKKFNSLISEGILNGEKIILAKPQTFMNDSGKAVKKVVPNVKCQMSNVLVIHDDIDLPLGKIRIVKNRGAAGHKGVESVIKELKTKNFIRFRIGIKPEKTESRKQKTEAFVLQKFNKDEEKIAKEVIEKTVEAIEFSLKEGLEKAMSKFNK